MDFYSFRENVVPWLIVGISTVATLTTSSLAIEKYIVSTKAGVISLPTAPNPPTTPSLNPQPTSNQSTQTIADSRCIVTLFGQQFDVTRLQTTHDGGNIFICGADMTAAYRDKHGTSLDRMRPYTLSAQIGSTTPAAGAVNRPEKEDEAEDDD